MTDIVVFCIISMNCSVTDVIGILRHLWS